MTNEELTQVMNFIIQRQEEFAERMIQAEDRLVRIEQIVEKNALQQSHTNNVLAAVVEVQQRTALDIAGLASVIDRVVEAMPPRADGDNRAST